MPPLTLEGHTLGEKHKHFNKLVQDTIANKEFHFTKIKSDEGDIHNLLMIDAAAKIKNVDYIIEVLKCDDMLYVSRAIKQSTWLITEQEYAHIINPEYLYTQLFPHMLTKAINKFLLHIRLHLKDEKRVEAFYDYLKDISKDANKWLLNCSIQFLEKVMENERDLTVEFYKRLCERSITFLKYHTILQGYKQMQGLKEVLFLLKSNPEEYLNCIEATAKNHCCPPLGKKYTEFVMKTCPNRILDNFKLYMAFVDVSMVAKHIKKEDIKSFLLKYMKKDSTRYFFSNFNNLKHFINKMPKEDGFEFVKNTYIDRVEPALPLGESVAMCCSVQADCMPSCAQSTYYWYQYAPFNVAFAELKKLVRAESSPAERCAILSVLITCARNNPQYTKTLLQYYFDKHRNEPFKFKVQFVNNVITQMATYEFNSETWNILDKLFYSMEVYTESDNNVHMCINAIVLYKVLHDENIPDIIEKKISFDSYKNYIRKLNKQQQTKIFSYLIKPLTEKIQNKAITNESDFNDTIDLLNNALNLLKDWKKDIQDYAFVHCKIQELLQLRKQKSWKTELSSLYNINKSWRRHMFEESLMLCPNEDACLNALKHEPQLLIRHSQEIDALKVTDADSMKRLHSKLRIYWPDTLAQQWTNEYLNHLEKNTGKKAVIKSLFTLVPQERLIQIAKKYVPDDSKIEWNEVNQTELSLRKNIAQSLYVARPLTPLDTVLWYAKGDYLQYAVPSLNAILHNLSEVQGRGYISKLLQAPVSLQKFGIHLAFMKLNYEELKPVFLDLWRTTKNSTIRSQLFLHTYKLLCKVKEESDAKELWQLLSMFIENLTVNDNKNIFNKLSNVEKVHVSIQGEYYVKSYEFLASLPVGANMESYLNNLINAAPKIMHLLDADFVANKVLAPIEEKITKPRSPFNDIISSYVLHGKSEDDQCERFRRVLAPALEHALKLWDIVKDDEYVMKENIDLLINALIWDFRKFIILKKIVAPVKLFSQIQSFMKEKFSMEENYGRYTSWSLITEYVKLVAEHKDMLCNPTVDNLRMSDFQGTWMPEDAERVWEALHLKISPSFGPIIVKHLKDDIEKYFPTITWLFGSALNTMFNYLTFSSSLMEMETLKYMVVNNDFVPSYLVVCDEIPKYGSKDVKEKRLEIRKILSAHPSIEVKMYYQKVFGGMPDSI